MTDETSRRDSLLAVETEFNGLEDSAGIPVESARLRCLLYRAGFGEPSLPIAVVRRHECAGPAIILDEIEKVGTGRHNGNVHDVLVGLFEPETSRRCQAPYVQTSCDLSHLSWLMTAHRTCPLDAAGQVPNPALSRT